MEDLRLQDALVFLVAAGLVIPAVTRLRISPVLGYLLIGLAIGPYGLARFTDDVPWLEYLLFTDINGVRALAELGVVFLLFMIGLDLSFERLWSMRRLVFGMGSTQIVATGLVIGAIAWGFGNSVEASIVLGSCLALSSTAVVMQLLIEQGRFGSTVGRGTFAVLLAQDMAVVPVLFLVGTLGSYAGGSLATDLGWALGKALFAILMILGVGRLIVRPVLRFVARAKSPELFMAVTLLAIIATAIITHASGLSAALGAFLAGLLLAESEYRREIEINIEPFKGLLLGLFFMAVGSSIDLFQVARDPTWIALSVAGLFGIKALVMSGVGRLFGFGWPAATEMGLLLSQGGEFAFVVVGSAATLGLLPESTAQFMLIVVGTTMLLAPLVARGAQGLSDAVTEHGLAASELAALPSGLTDHVIIVGYGRTGQLLAALLEHQDIAHVALDLDQDRVATLRSQGAPIELGDASRPAMLEKMRVRDAALIAVCTDDPGATEAVLQAARQLTTHVPIVARARDNDHAERLLALGASRAVPELFESGLRLGHVMLEEMDLPAEVARDLIDTHRAAAEGPTLAAEPSR